MENNKNYYMTVEIGDSGVADTRNPIYIQEPSYDERIRNFTNKNLARAISEGKIAHDSSSFLGVGDSKYDSEIIGLQSSILSGEDINDLRRQQQTTLDRWTNALVNNITIAGTSILDTAGLLYGLIDGAVNWDANRIIAENPMLQATQDIRSNVAEAMPIYRGQKYEDKSLWGKMGTQIFWAELFQNLGYVEGAALTGGGVGTLMKSAPKWARYIIPNLIASSSEAAVEAQGRREEYIDANKQKATDAYLDAFSKAGSIEEIEMLQDTYGRALDSIEEDATKQANFTFLSNLALLSVANQINMGRLFSRGFGSGVKLKGAARRLDDGVYSMLPKGEVLTRKALTEIGEMSAEGLQEVGQEIIPKVTENYLDYNTFNESEFNLEKRELVTNLWESAGKAITETFDDPHTAEAFAMGFLTKAIGVPTVGKRGPTLYGNLASELYQTNREYNKQSKLVDDINARLSQDNVLSSLYSGLVRHSTIGDSMDIALDENNHYDYETASSAQIISDIMMFDDIGDIKGMKSMLESVDFTDDFVSDIIDQTTKENESGELEGPFIQDKKKMSIEDAKNLMNEKKESILKIIDQYSTTKDYIERSYPGINESALRNALYVSVQQSNHLDRFNRLNEELNTLLDTILNNTKSKVSEDVHSTLSSAKSNLIEYISNKDLLVELSKTLTIASHYSTNEVLAFTENYLDLNKIANNIEILGNSLMEIYNDPIKSVKEKQNREIKAEEKDAIEEVSNIIEELENKSLKELANLRTDINVDNNILDAAASKVEGLETRMQEASKLNKNISSIMSEIEGMDHLSLDDKQSILNKIDEIASTVENSEDILNKELLSRNPIGDIVLDTALEETLDKVKDNTINNIPAQIDNEVPKNIEGITKDDVALGNKLKIKDDASSSSLSKEEKEEVKAYFQDTSDPNLTEFEEETIIMPSTFAQAWKPSITEYWDTSKENKPTNIKETDRGIPESQKEKYPHAETIYSYLSSVGAFYNARKLKENDIIKFTTDDTLNNKVETIVILLSNKDGQIVGSMPIPADNTAFNGYSNFSSFYDAFTKEFSEYRKENTDQFFYSKPSKVTNTYYGRSVKGTQRTLKQLFQETGQQIQIGRYDPLRKNYVFNRGSLSNSTTTLEKSVIIPNVPNKSRFVTLIQTTDGKYTIPISIPRFNNTNKDLFMGTSIYKTITESISILLEDLRGKNVGDGITVYTKKTKDSILRFKDTFMDVFNTFNPSDKTNKVSIQTSNNGTQVSIKFNSFGEDKVITFNVADNVESILDKLFDADLILEVKYSQLKALSPILAEVALTNVVLPHTVNDRFTIEDITVENNKEELISVEYTEEPRIDSEKESLKLIDQPLNKQVTWERVSSNSYEVSTAGDRRFSALNARFKNGTIIFGHDVSDRTIESVYQHGVKQDDWITDNNSKTGKPKSNKIIKGNTEDSSYYEGYLPLWKEWAKQNTSLLNDLRQKARGKVLTDKFANTKVSQARALADILNVDNSKNTWQSLGINPRDPQFKVVIDVLSQEQIDTILSADKVKAKALKNQLQRITPKVKRDSKLLKDKIAEIFSTKYSKVNTSINTPSPLNLKKELRWLKRVLPMMETEGRIQIVDNLIKVSSGPNPEYAWGQFKQGVITIYNKAIGGTVFHEAFHAVTNMLLSDSEVKALFTSAKGRYGNLSNLELEERLADDFARYISIAETPILGTIAKIFNKIKSFVDILFGKENYIENLFYRINNGKYIDADIKNTNATRYSKINDLIDIKRTSINLTLNTVKSVTEVGYPSEREALEAVEKLGYNKALFEAPEYKGKHYLKSSIAELNTVYVDKKAGISKVNPNSLIDINVLERLQDKYFDRIDENEESSRLLLDQEVYYRRMNTYYNSKYSYENLSKDNKDLLKIKNISEEQYNKLSRQVKENILYCR